MTSPSAPASRKARAYLRHGQGLGVLFFLDQGADDGRDPVLAAGHGAAEGLGLHREVHHRNGRRRVGAGRDRADSLRLADRVMGQLPDARAGQLHGREG